MGVTALLPVARQALDVPPDRLAAVIGTWPEPAILHGGTDFGEAGRWSIFAAYPRLVFEATGRRWTLVDDSGSAKASQGDPLLELAWLARQFGLAGITDGAASARAVSDGDGAETCPFQGGLIGFFGYDMAPLLERLPRRSLADSRLPDIRFGLYDTAVTVDNLTSEVVLHAWDILGEGREATERRSRSWRRAILAHSYAYRPIPATRVGPLASNFKPDQYLQGVRRAIEYIEAGDVFQINLSQRFTALGSIEPLDLFLRLNCTSPAPYSAFLCWGNLAVISASPELFYETVGPTVVTRPIKGTRPRVADVAEDQLMIQKLASSVKDRAELIMIVDLERNDLGKVCGYGSVRVIDPLAVESFAQVHHLVATVEGRLRDGTGPIDVVRAVFPGGSITGAPKIRAMQIIDELEPNRRGLYTGAIGFLGRGGRSGFNIAIRTMVVEANRVSYQVGGGVVADSDPQAEFEETLHKGRGLRAVIERKEGS